MYMNGNMTKQQILSALSAFVATRPNLEQGNYASRADYQRDYRQHCLNPKNDYLDLEASISWRDSLTAFDLLQSIRETSRVEILRDGTIEYTPGQYYPAEYRHAACNVLAGALWDYWATDTPIGMTPRQYVVQQANIEFRPRIVRNYFN